MQAQQKETGHSRMFAIMGAQHAAIDGLTHYNFDATTEQAVLEFASAAKMADFEKQLNVQTAEPASPGMALMRQYYQNRELVLRVSEPV